MKVIVPMLCNASREPVGVFSVQTSQGAMVFLFTNQARWERFVQPVGRVLRKQNNYIASMEFEVNELDDVVDKLAELDPGIVDEATFLPDSAPIFADVLAYFEGQD